jgi:hypothetical protein
MATDDADIRKSLEPVLDVISQERQRGVIEAVLERDRQMWAAELAQGLERLSERSRRRQMAERAEVESKCRIERWG